MQDYLGREGAEQFLSDWDEERSSSSSSPSSPPSLSPGPLPPATAFAVNRGSDGANATRCLQEPAPIEPPPPLLPPPKIVADSMNEIQRSNSAAQTHTQDVHSPARSGGGRGGHATAAIAGRSPIPTRKGRVPPSVPVGDAAGAGAESVILRKVIGDATSSARLAPVDVRTAAQTSDLSEPSCGGLSLSVSKTGDAGVSTAVPAQDDLKARDASAKHSPKSDADGVVSQDFAQRRLLSRTGMHQHPGNNSTEPSTDPAMTSAAADPSPKTLEFRFDSEGGDADAGRDDRASGRGGHGSNSGCVRVRKSGTVYAGIGATSGAGAVCEVDGGKGSVDEAVASALPAVGRRRRPSRSSLLDLAYQSIDDI